MAHWSIIKSVSFRVKPEGKGIQERRIDLTTPLKSLKELEDKVGLNCPDDVKKQLIGSLNNNNTHSWLENVSIPEWYITASNDDITNALRWGYELVQEKYKLGEDKLHEHLNVKWKKSFEQSKDEFEKYKNETESKREQITNEFQQQLIQKEKEIQGWQHTAINNLSATGIEEKIQKLKQEWAEEHKVVLSAVERERHTLAQQVDYLRLKTTQLEQERIIMQNKLEQKVTHESLMNKSTYKGDEGEQLVDTWLRTAFLGANIVDTSNETGKMDRQLIWEDTTIIIDVKHHDGKLHSLKDVKKFHDNFLENGDAQIAILLCTKTNVPNHNRFWVETEIFGEDKVAIYMNNVSENPIERLQLVVGTVIEPWKKYIKLMQNMRELTVGDELKTWSNNARSVLLNGWTLVMRLSTQWSKTQNVIQTNMNDFQSELAKVAQEMKDSLESISIQVDTPSVAKRVKSKK